MTAQARDKFIYNGEEHHLAVEPLYPYLKKKNIRFLAPDTACWRGYIGTWLFEDDNLYLTELTAYIPDPTKSDARYSRIEVGLDYLFPNQEKVFAEWFSGVIHIPHGKMIRYVHQGYASIYEKEILLRFEKGKYVGYREIDNTHLSGDKHALDEMEMEGIFNTFGITLKKRSGWIEKISDKIKSLFSHRNDDYESNKEPIWNSGKPIIIDENEIMSERLQELQSCLLCLHNFPNAMKMFNEVLWRNASTYSCSLDSEVSIYSRIPEQLFTTKELFSKIEEWEVFKNEWYKSLASNYPKSWIPIADFKSEKDELFVDISTKRLPVIVARYMSRNDFRPKEICDSLTGFVNNYLNLLSKRNNEN